MWRAVGHSCIKQTLKKYIKIQKFISALCWATGFLRELGKPCTGELRHMHHKHYKRHERKQRQSLNLDSPFNPPIPFPTWILSFGSRTVMAWVCKDTSLERKQWKLNSIKCNRIRCYQADNILTNSAPLASGCMWLAWQSHFLIYDIVQMLQLILLGKHLMDVNCHEIIWKKKPPGTVLSLQPFHKFTLSKSFQFI